MDNRGRPQDPPSKQRVAGSIPARGASDSAEFRDRVYDPLSRRRRDNGHGSARTSAHRAAGVPSGTPRHPKAAGALQSRASRDRPLRAGGRLSRCRVVKSYRKRWLAALLMLACSGAQPAAGSALLVSALTIALLHGSDHAHAVSLIPGEGHAHLVLSHVEGDSHEHGGAPRHDESETSLSEADHVFHLTGGDAENATPRRAAPNPGPPLAISLAAPFARALTWILRPAPDPLSRSSGNLRAVVLRL